MLRFVLCLTLGFVLSGCGLVRLDFPSSEDTSGSRVSGGGTPGTKSYTVRGKRYTPLKSANGFWEEGVASWYGKQFHGRLTANGERYDMYGMTAAHKLLPFNTRVRVRNLRNNRTVIVRVNDRGPFIDDRIIDLTYTAAQRLDMIGPGTARVRVEALDAGGTSRKTAATSSKASSRATVSSPSGTLYIQLAAVREKRGADTILRRLSGLGLKGRTFYASNLRLWRVQAGPFPNTDRARTALNRLQKALPGCFITNP